MDPCFAGFLFLFQFGDLRLIFRDQRLLLRHVAAHGFAECLQLRDRVLRSRAGGFDRRFVHAERRHGVGVFLQLVLHRSLLRRERVLPALQRSLCGCLLLQLLAQRLQLSFLTTGARVEPRKLLLNGIEIVLYCRGEQLHLLLLLCPAQDLVFGFAQRGAHSRHFKFCFCRRGSGVCRLTAQLLQLFRERAALLLQPLQSICTCQNARASGRGAAGHAAARVHDLSVERHDAHAVSARPRHRDGVVERIADYGAPQRILNDRAVLRLALNKPGRDGNEARLPLAGRILQALGADGRQRQEGRPAAVAALEHLNGCLAVLLRGDNNILHGGAEHRLDGRRILVFHMDELRQWAVDAAQLSGCCVLHDKADSLGKALVIAFQFLQHADLGIDRIQLHTGSRHLLLQAVALVLPRFQAQLITGNGIFCALHVLLRLRKALAAVCLLGRDLHLPRLRRFLIFVQHRSALLHLFHRCFHRSDLCLQRRALRLDERLLRTDGNELLRQLRRGRGELLSLCLYIRKLLPRRRKRLLRRLHFLLFARDLPGNAAAAILLGFEFLLYTCNITPMVLHFRL